MVQWKCTTENRITVNFKPFLGFSSFRSNYLLMKICMLIKAGIRASQSAFSGLENRASNEMVSEFKRKTVIQKATFQHK